MFITTSREASIATRAFARDLSKSIPRAEYFSRGTKPLNAIIEEAKFNAIKCILIVSEEKKQPAFFNVIIVMEKEWHYTTNAKIVVMKLKKEFKSKEKIDSMALQFSSKKIKKMFGELGVKSASKSNFLLKENKNTIFFYKKINNHLKEIGPRFKIEWIEFEKRI